MNFHFVGSSFLSTPCTRYLPSPLYTKDGWGANYLKTYITVLSPEGEVRETIPYTSENETVYWFPSEIVF